MSGEWQVTGTSTVTQNAPAGAAAAGLQLRVRAISGSVSGAGTLTIKDSVPNTYYTIAFTAAAVFEQSDLDIRIAVGLNMTAAFSANGTGINVEGDFVPIGYPYGLT